LRETLKPLELPEDALRSAYGQARYLDANTVSTALDLLAFFAEHLCAEESQLRALAGTGGTTPVATALRYLHDYHTEDISLTGVARQVGWTPSYFSARFRAITGFTFVDYLHRLRVHHAQTLLQDTSRTVTDIAYACGFNSQSQFNRVFRAVTGTSPRAYRK
jgi:transcriptional regulator GlxA family with amidase domain